MNRIIAVISLIILSFATHLLRPQAHTESLLLGAVLVVLGIGASVYYFRQPQTSRLSIPHWENPFHRINFALLLAAFGCIAIVLMMNLNADAPIIPTASQHIQVLLLLLGAILLWIALVGVDAVRHIRISSASIWIAIGLFLVALFPRVWMLTDAVSVPVADEYAFIDTAIALWDKNDYPLLEPFDSGYAFTWSYPYLVLVSMEIFGWDVFATRLPSAIVGAATIPALYLLTTQLFTWRIGLAAALLLAVFPPHLHLSRMVLNNIFDPFFGVVALGLIVYAFKKNSYPAFIGAGILLGFTQYFYEAGRLLFAPLVILWLVLIISRLKRQRIPFTWRIIALFALSVTVISTPVIVTFIERGYSPAPRFAMVAPAADDEAQILAATVDRNILESDYLSRLQGVLLHFVHRLDNSPDFYGGQQAMLLPLVVPLFFIGIAIALCGWRHPAYQLILLWLAMGIFGIALVRIGAWTARFAPLFPVMMLIVALGINGIINTLVVERYRRVGLVMILAACLLYQVNYYFGEHLPYYNEQVREVDDFADAFHRAVDLPRNAALVFVTDQTVWMPYLRILGRLWQRSDLEVLTLTPDTLVDGALQTLSDDVATYFYVEPSDTATLSQLQARYVLDGPYMSPYVDVPEHRVYALYYAVSVKN